MSGDYNNNGELKVGYEALDGVASSLRGAALKIEDKITQLEQSITKEFANWEDDAQLAYHEAQRKWDGAMDAIKTIVAQMGTDVGLTNDEYKRAEKSNAARFQ